MKIEIFKKIQINIRAMCDPERENVEIVNFMVYTEIFKGKLLIFVENIIHFYFSCKNSSVEIVFFPNSMGK